MSFQNFFSKNLQVTQSCCNMHNYKMCENDSPTHFTIKNNTKMKKNLLVSNQENEVVMVLVHLILSGIYNLFPIQRFTNQRHC